MLTCVSTMRYSLKLNGTILDSFAPSRSLRQGDLLSPYLFLFVVDGLSALIEERTFLGNVTPIKVRQRAPSISHFIVYRQHTSIF